MDKDKKLDLVEFAKCHGYTLDYLSSGSPIFQVKNLYMFTSDSIKLAHSIEEDNIDNLLDLCSGSGVVGLEVAENKKVKNLTLVELQPDLAQASRFSADYFKHNTNINVVNDSVLNLSNHIKNKTIDVVVCNPPYFKKGCGVVCENKSRAMARHELDLTLEAIIKEVKRVLRPTGKLYLIHINSRLSEIETMLKKYDLTLTKKIVLEGKLERVIVVAKNSIF